MRWGDNAMIQMTIALAQRWLWIFFDEQFGALLVYWSAVLLFYSSAGLLVCWWITRAQAGAARSWLRDVQGASIQNRIQTTFLCHLSSSLFYYVPSFLIDTWQLIVRLLNKIYGLMILQNTQKTKLTNDKNKK